MPMRICKDCKDEYYTFSNLQTRCAKCQAKRSKPKQRKPLRQKGKVTIAYEKWRDTIAIPYLIEKYGHLCSKCGRHKVLLDYLGIPLDVDHIEERGSRADLRMVLSNVRFLCRDCHSKRK